MMEPLISLNIRDHRREFEPGDVLAAEYQVEAIDDDQIQAIESSVLWYTEGKGDEDMAIHHFERRLPNDTEDGDMRVLHRFETTLPNTPLSYSGVIVKICWCVRVRVFLKGRQDIFFEQYFQLGSVSSGRVYAS